MGEEEEEEEEEKEEDSSAVHTSEKGRTEPPTRGRGGSTLIEKMGSRKREGVATLRRRLL